MSYSKGSESSDSETTEDSDVDDEVDDPAEDDEEETPDPSSAPIRLSSDSMCCFFTQVWSLTQSFSVG